MLRCQLSTMATDSLCDVHVWHDSVDMCATSQDALEHGAVCVYHDYDMIQEATEAGTKARASRARFIPHLSVP